MPDLGGLLTKHVISSQGHQNHHHVPRLPKHQFNPCEGKKRGKRSNRKKQYNTFIIFKRCPKQGANSISAIKQCWDLLPMSPFIPALTWCAWCHEVQSRMESCWKLCFVFPGWIFHFILNLCCYYYYSIICCIKCEPPAAEPSGGEVKRLFSRSGLMPVPSSSSQLNPDLLLQYCPVNHLESILINALCLLGPVQRHEGLCLCGLIQFQWYPQ